MADNIPIKVEKDEYVVNAKAVRKHGLKRLDKINEKGLPKELTMKNGRPVRKSKKGGSARRTRYQQGGTTTDAMSPQQLAAYKVATGDDIRGSAPRAATTPTSSQGVRASAGGTGVKRTPEQMRRMNATLKSLTGMKHGGAIKVTTSDKPKRKY